jgi:DNA-binding MarR family transcriptional regulator
LTIQKARKKLSVNKVRRLTPTAKDSLFANPLFGAWAVLSRTGFGISRLRNLEVAEIGVTREQSDILERLKIQGGKATVTDLAIRSMRPRHSVSTLVERMHKQGLIKKSRFPNRKDLEISLTQKGQSLVDKKKTESIVVAMAFSSLSTKEHQKLCQYLKLILIRSLSLLEIDINFNKIDILNEETYRTYSPAFYVWRLLDDTRSVIDRLYDIEMAKINITQEQSIILQTLMHQQGKATVTQICSQWMRQRHSVFTLCQRMQKRGLVKILKDSKNKEIEITITEKGIKQFQKMTLTPIDLIFSFLPQVDIQKLTQYLQQVFNVTCTLLNLDHL